MVPKIVNFWCFGSKSSSFPLGQRNIVRDHIQSVNEVSKEHSRNNDEWRRNYAKEEAVSL